MNPAALTHPIPPTLTIIAALCLGSVALAQPSQADLKQRVLTQAQSIGLEDYASTRTIKSEQTPNGKTEQHVNIDKFDPTKSGGARWTLVSVDGAVKLMPSSRFIPSPTPGVMQ